MKRGVLLINLGSPKSPSPSDVRTYLREFLSDDRVLDSPKVVQQAVLNLLILPKRPAESGHAYEQIWTDEGSPLVVSTFRQRDLLRARLGDSIPVEVGMRYGEPSTADGLRALFAQGVDDVLIVPLYPHYAMSSYETAAVRAIEAAGELNPGARITIQPPFFDAPDYIDALRDSVAPFLETEWDGLLFSYHGIPERHVRKSDPTGAWCLGRAECCDVPNVAHGTCYRAQVFATTRALCAAAQIPNDKVHVAFQSRLGRDPWLRPFTDHVLQELPSQGVKKVLVICPAFVSDCLETLEEIEMRGREDFMEAGGHEFTYIPCLNESDAWIGVLQRMVSDWSTLAAAE